MNTRNLFIFFLFLLGIYGLSQFYTQKSAINFHTHLIQIDTSAINTILIKPYLGNEINLQRIDSGWQITNETVTTKVNNLLAASLLEQLIAVKTSRVVTNEPEKWEHYGLDAKATQVQIFDESRRLENFLIGKELSQQVSDTTYIRLVDENEVYAVPDFGQAYFTKGFDAYRERRVLQLVDNQSIKRISYIDGIGVFLDTIDGLWKDERGELVDSLDIVKYISDLNYVEASAFADDFDETRGSHLPTQKLILQGDDITPAIQIIAYQDTSATPPFIIHSSQFPDAFYASDSNGIYRQIFNSILKDSLDLEKDMIK